MNEKPNCTRAEDGPGKIRRQEESFGLSKTLFPLREIARDRKHFQRTFLMENLTFEHGSAAAALLSQRIRARRIPPKLSPGFCLFLRQSSMRSDGLPSLFFLLFFLTSLKYPAEYYYFAINIWVIFYSIFLRENQRIDSR